METGKFRGINIKLIAAILIPAVIAFGLLSVVMIHERSSTFHESMESNAHTVMDLMQKISVPCYENFEYATLDEYAEVAVKDPQIQFISFFDPNGGLLTEDLHGEPDDPSTLVFEREIHVSFRTLN